MRIKVLLLSIGALSLMSGAAHAQDPRAQATYGSRSLTAGFTPDPHIVNLTAGGSIQASSVGTGCSGMIAGPPDYELTYTAGSFPLIFRTASSADTTLVVNGPNGSWYCDDDGAAEALNAEVRFNSPRTGTYDIWVGTYSGGMESARLEISELDAGGSSVPTPVNNGQRPDPTLTANYGTVRMSANFSPDPYRVSLRAGGALQASTVGAGCVGGIAPAPDFELTYEAGSLPLIFRTTSSADTTLVINGPNGSWYCDDDGGTEGLNAEVRFNSPQSGVYDVWVGTLSSGLPQTTLEISEIGGGSTPVPASDGERPDATLPATYGSIRLSTGYAPDPYTVNNINAGGTIDASLVATECAGTVARPPDFELTYTAGNLPLIFRTVSSGDTTLMINDPNGDWFCDDDSGGSLNAELRWDRPESGVYDVWVGDLSGTLPLTTLQISEVGGDSSAPTPTTSTLMPDASLTAAYGEITLRSGFTPDPRRIALRAGGPVPAANANDGCTGSIARAPDYQITYTAGRQPLIIRTESDTDTTLVINDPDGVWHCDDDSRGEGNAEVNLDKPSSGVYDVWVGTFGGGTAAATLILTERP